jgi:hypothetical protein
VFAPWVLGYDEAISIANDTIAGVLIILFALVKRKTKNQYGGGWIQLFKRNMN